MNRYEVEVDGVPSEVERPRPWQIVALAVCSVVMIAPEHVATFVLKLIGG